MALKNMLTREIKYTRKTEKSAFREFFVARYIPILQYFCLVLMCDYYGSEKQCQVQIYRYNPGWKIQQKGVYCIAYLLT